jgi:hypothetical protein
MNVTGGSTDVSTFFMMRLSATGVHATGLTIANFSMQYTRTGDTPAAHAHPTALAAANTAHTDERAIEVDATNSPGLYRFDWPDAAFAAGVKQVALYVSCATAFSEAQVVDIDPPVNVATIVAAVLDHDVTAHNTASTVGAALNDVGAIHTHINDIHDTDLPAVATDVAATHVHAAAADTQTVAAAVRTAVGLASANLDTQLAAANNGAPPTAAAIADAICDEAINTGHAGANSLAKILYDNLNAPVATVDTVVDGIVTTLGAAGAGLTTLATAANLAVVAGYLDTEVAAILAAVDTEVAAIKAKTDNLPEGIQKNTALNNFEFFMADSADHVSGKTGLTVTSARSIDGGAFGACANSAVQVGNGVYRIDLATTDLNGDIVTLRFSATGADDTVITIKTEA